MNAGQLRHSITFWRNEEMIKGKTFCAIETKISNSITHVFTIRYSKDVTKDSYIVFKDRKFEVNRIVNINENNQWLEIYTTEK